MSFVHDERSDMKQPSIFNYENSTCSETSTLPAAPPFIQMTHDSINDNNNVPITKENIPFDSIKKELLPLLMTGKERLADKKEEVILVS